jgi:hypothetical protein
MGASLFRPSIACFTRFQEARRYIPAATIVGNNGNRFPVVTSEHSDYGRPILWLEGHAVPDTELRCSKRGQERERDGARTIPLRIVVTREVAVPNYTDLDGCQMR